MKEYLKRVQVLLQQETPTEVKDSISVEGDLLMIRLEVNNMAFDDRFNDLHHLIIALLSRIRVRQYDLKFSVWTPFQSRDFTVLK